jgi:Uri superfamily endonuclease
MMRGVYVLIISIGKDITVNVGALGKVNFEKGLYAYVGSAQNNLEKRLKRHFRKVKRKFWHIDYLLENKSVNIVRIFCKEAEKPEECRIARILSEKGFPVKLFGCSDCHCVSHLFRIDDYGFLRDFMGEMQF